MAYMHNGSLRHGRRHFFSELLHRWSFLAQHPVMVTFREAVGLVYFLYCAYLTVLTLATLRTLLWHTQVEDVCGWVTSGMDCLQVYVWRVLWEVAALLGNGLQWFPVVVIVIFFGEEAISRWRAKP